MKSSPVRKTILSLLLSLNAASAADAPNILFIFTDDHALNAISAYGGPLAKIAPTPNLDRIASEGMIFNHCLVTNSICAPSRAVILTFSATFSASNREKC